MHCCTWPADVQSRPPGTTPRQLCLQQASATGGRLNKARRTIAGLVRHSGALPPAEQAANPHRAAGGRRRPLPAGCGRCSRGPAEPLAQPRPPQVACGHGPAGAGAGVQHVCGLPRLVAAQLRGDQLVREGRRSGRCWGWLPPQRRQQRCQKFREYWMLRGVVCMPHFSTFCNRLAPSVARAAGGIELADATGQVRGAHDDVVIGGGASVPIISILATFLDLLEADCSLLLRSPSPPLSFRRLQGRKPAHCSSMRTVHILQPMALERGSPRSWDDSGAVFAMEDFDDQAAARADGHDKTAALAVQQRLRELLQPPTHLVRLTVKLQGVPAVCGLQNRLTGRLPHLLSDCRGGCKPPWRWGPAGWRTPLAPCATSAIAVSTPCRLGGCPALLGCSTGLALPAGSGCSSAFPSRSKH